MITAKLIREFLEFNPVEDKIRFAKIMLDELIAQSESGEQKNIGDHTKEWWQNRVDAETARAAEMEARYDKLTVEFFEKIEAVTKATKEKAAKIAGSYDASVWSHCLTSCHAADMVASSIAANIRGMK